MRRKAFTLIELLIVVAIIAILAAIAVPNFLEAQTRSKVSRCKADERSLAVAIEAYRIDFNYYPFDNTWDILQDYPLGKDKLMMLTSPQAYITSIPKDPFGGVYNHINTEGFETTEESKSYYFYENSWSGNAYWAEGKSAPDHVDVPSLTDSGKTYPLYACWQINSDGPSKTWYTDVAQERFPAPDGGDGGDARCVCYDPTNGTKSLGVVSRWGP